MFVSASVGTAFYPHDGVTATALLASAVVAFIGAALRARRTVRPRADPSLIEARNVGGHHWVAYGWDGGH